MVFPSLEAVSAGQSSSQDPLDEVPFELRDDSVAGPEVPFRSEEGLLIVPVSMSGGTIRLAIDTGAHLTAVYASAVKSLDKRALDEKLVKVAHSAGAVTGRQITLSTVQLGTAELDRLPVVLLQAKKPGAVDGFLGTASLGLARLHLDFCNQVLSLVQK